MMLPQVHVDEDTKIALYAAASVVVTAVMTTWWLSRMLNNMKASITGLRHEFELFRESQKDNVRRANHSVSRNEARMWARLLQAQNPELKVPPFGGSDGHDESGGS